MGYVERFRENPNDMYGLLKELGNRIYTGKLLSLAEDRNEYIDYINLCDQEIHAQTARQNPSMYLVVRSRDDMGQPRSEGILVAQNSKILRIGSDKPFADENLIKFHARWMLSRLFEVVDLGLNYI